MKLQMRVQAINSHLAVVGTRPDPDNETGWIQDEEVQWFYSASSEDGNSIVFRDDRDAFGHGDTIVVTVAKK